MKKQRLSRKKLTEREALEKIGHLSIQLQTEKENLMINYYPNRNKSWEELDRITRFILTVDSYGSMEECITASEERVKEIEWKMYEDYGRFVSKGVHILPSGHLFVKQ